MSAKMPKNTCTQFTDGTMIWAVLRGHQAWPAIMIPDKEEKKSKSRKWVLFFGTKDCASIKKSDMAPYDEAYELLSQNPGRRLKIAINAADEYKRLLPLEEENSEDDADTMRQKLLLEVSDAAKKDANEKERQNLKRKEAPCGDSIQSCQARKKPKLSPSEDVDEKPKPSGRPKANIRSLVSKEHKMSSFAKNARKEPRSAGKPEANNADLKKTTSGENSTPSGKVSKRHKIAATAKDLKKPKISDSTKDSKKPKIADSAEDSKKPKISDSAKYSKKPKIADSAEDSKKPKTANSDEDSKKGPKRSKKPEANNKIGMEKRSSGRKSAEPRNTSAKPKMSVSVKILRRGPKRTSKSHVFNKTGMEKHSSKGKSAQPRKTSEKPKTAASAKNLRSQQKPASQPEVSNKTGMENHSSDGKSEEPRKTSEKTKTADSAKNLSEQKPAPQPEVFIKKCKIFYMPPTAPSPVIPGRSITSRAFEIANGRIVYDSDIYKRTVIRSTLQPPLTLGFVGIGELAHTLVSRLVRAGMRVLIWNRSARKCSGLVRRGAILADTPADVAAESDIVFCCVRGTGPITEVCFGGLIVGLDGIVPGLKRNPRTEKGFVMLSSIKPETSMIISQDFENANTKYLEAQVLLKSRVRNCNIKILCAGNRNLYEILSCCFACIKVHFTFVSNVLGEASRMKYAHTIVNVGYSLSIVEALAVLQDSQTPFSHLNMILDELHQATHVMRNKINDIVFRKRNLGDTIKELKDVLKELSEWYPKRPLSLATAALEAVEHAARVGSDNRNVSAMCDLLI